MSVLTIVLIVVAALAAIFFVGGLIAVRRRARRPETDEHIQHALRALEQARASDRGWDPVVMERIARGALEQHRPGSEWHAIHLVLVDDRPGMTDDTAHMLGRGPEGDARVILLRREGGEWFAERVE
jgi:hypothetical protein